MHVLIRHVFNFIALTKHIKFLYLLSLLQLTCVNNMERVLTGALAAKLAEKSNIKIDNKRIKNFVSSGNTLEIYWESVNPPPQPVRIIFFYMLEPCTYYFYI